MRLLSELWTAYRMRLKRRRLLFRAFRKRRQLTQHMDQTAKITNGDILAFSTVRNEIERLPYFLSYYRSIGVQHFLVVDNASTDGTTEFLSAQPDVSVWTTPQSYKLSRFGMDWLTWLLIKYGHGHWCLTVDADEILVYPQCDTKPLSDLTEWLDRTNTASFGAIMLDMYPKGLLDAVAYRPGQNPFEILEWFDADNFTRKVQPALQNLWIQGGVRARCFFSDRPQRAPTLNKIPLVKWNQRYAYVTSTHAMLPRKLNHVFEKQTEIPASGALLHSKFLHMIVERSAEEKERQQHFANSKLYYGYYENLIANPDLWCEKSVKYTGWQQLVDLGLMNSGTWSGPK